MILLRTKDSYQRVILAFLLVFCFGLLTACGGNDNNSASNGNNSGNTPTPGSSNNGGGNGGSNSTAGGFVYVGNNAGGISAFSINASDGNLTPVQGSPFASTSVIDIAVADNTVADTENAGLVSWKIDASTGALTKVATNSDTGFAYLTGQGDNIYASRVNTGVYAFTASNGSLTAAGSPASVASLCQDCSPGRLDSNGQFVFVMSSGFKDVYDFAAIPRGANGALGTAHSFGGGVDNSTFSALDEAVAPNNRFLYESWETSNAINVYQVDPSNGNATLVKAEAAHAGDEGQDAVVTRDGKFLLVLNNVSNNISVFSLDASTGLPTAVSGSPFATGSRPVRMAFDTTGKYLYVICSAQGTKDIFGYRMDASSGALTQVAHQNIGGDPHAIAVK